MEEKRCARRLSRQARQACLTQCLRSRRLSRRRARRDQRRPLRARAAALYATTVDPLDREALRATAGLDVVVVEPFHEGTLAAQLMAALAGRAVRLTSIGVGREIVHRYATSADHDRAHGLDIGGLHERIARAVERAPVAS